MGPEERIEMKDIEEYEGLYAITKDGRIWSYPKWDHNGMFLRTTKVRQGYLTVSLSKNGKGKRKYIHRLIAIYFIPNPNNKPQVNHKNGIKTDNRIDNLEWVTRQEDCIHAVKQGLIKMKLNPQDVRLIRMLYPTWSVRELVVLFEVSRSTIYAILSGRIWKHI